MHFHSSWSQAVGSQCFEPCMGHLLWAPTREHMVWEETETPSRNVLVSNQRICKESKPTPLQEGTHGPHPVFAMALHPSGKSAWALNPLRWLFCTSQSRRAWPGGANVTLRVQRCLLAMPSHARLPCLGFPQCGDPQLRSAPDLYLGTPGRAFLVSSPRMEADLTSVVMSQVHPPWLLTLSPSRTDQPKAVVSWVS